MGVFKEVPGHYLAGRAARMAFLAVALLFSGVTFYAGPVRAQDADTTNPVAMVSAAATAVDAGATVALDGSSSTDDVGITSHVWTAAVPAGGTGGGFSDAGSLTTTYTAPIVTGANAVTVTLMLTVLDGAGNQGTQTVDLTVNPRAGGVGVGITVSQARLTVTEGENAGAVYTVALQSAPTASVKIDVVAMADVRVATTGQSAATQIELDFDATNWSTPQTVVVVAVDDDDGTQVTAIITHRVNAVTVDTTYLALTGLPYVGVTVIDDDPRAVVVTPSPLTVPEGSNSSFKVKLATRPVGGMVTVRRVRIDGDLNLSGLSGGAVLTFTTDNWNRTQNSDIGAYPDSDSSDGVAHFGFNASGADYDSVSTSATAIEGDDTLPYWTLANATVDESATTVRMTVLLYTGNGRHTSGASVRYATQPETAPGKATEGADYTVTTGTIMAPDGSTRFPRQFHFDIPLLPDDLDEPTETFSVKLLDASSGTVLATSGAIVTIRDDDVPSVSVAVDNPANVMEGNPGSPPVTRIFTLTVDPVPYRTISVPYAISGVLVTDIAAQSLTGVIDVLAGADTASREVTIVPDSLDESDEILSFSVNTPFPKGYVLDSTASVAVVTIADDDAPTAPVGAGFTITPTTLTALEGDLTGVTYTVQPSTAPTALVKLVVTTSGDALVRSGSTTAGGSLTLNFETGTMAAQTVAVTAADDIDATDEAATISHAVGDTTDSAYSMVAGLPDVGVTILDNDPRAFVLTGTSPADGDGQLVEVHEGSSTDVMVALASQPVGGNVAVAVLRSGTTHNLRVAAGAFLTFTAANWNIPQTVTIGAGEDSGHQQGTVYFNVIGSGADYDGVTTVIRAREIDNDVGFWTVDSPRVSETDMTVRLTVVLDIGGTYGHRGDATIDYTVTDGTATAGADYGGASFTASGTFRTREIYTNEYEHNRTFHIDVPIIDDQLDEVDETFIVTLSNPSHGMQLGTPRGTVTIVDNDVAQVTISVDDPTAFLEGNPGDEGQVRTISVNSDLVVARNIDVPYTISGLQAADFEGGAVLQGGKITILSGATTGTLTITIVPDDLVEPSEVLAISLNTPIGGAGYQLGTPAYLDLSIIDDDSGTDTTAPVIATITGPDGIYGLGDSILLTVGFTEPVFLDTTGGTPNLSLQPGDSAMATYTGQPGNGTLTFTYVVGTGQTGDLDVTAAATGGATIKDFASNDVDFTTVPTGTAVGSLVSSSNVHIDKTPPTANAGVDQEVIPSATVTLDGSGSTDDGMVAAYAWRQTGGTGNNRVTIHHANTVNPTFTAPRETTANDLVFELTVTDTVGLSDNTISVDTVTVTVDAMALPPRLEGGASGLGGYRFEYIAESNDGNIFHGYPNPVQMPHNGVTTIQFRRARRILDVSAKDIDFVVQIAPVPPPMGSGTDRSRVTSKIIIGNSVGSEGDAAAEKSGYPHFKGLTIRPKGGSHPGFFNPQRSGGIKGASVFKEAFGSVYDLHISFDPTDPRVRGQPSADTWATVDHRPSVGGPAPGSSAPAFPSSNVLTPAPPILSATHGGNTLAISLERQVGGHVSKFQYRVNDGDWIDTTENRVLVDTSGSRPPHYNVRARTVNNNAHGFQRNSLEALATAAATHGALDTTAPTADAGPDQPAVRPGVTVTLAGLATDNVGVTSTTWLQTSGDRLVIDGSDGTTATFKAPTVTVATDLVFSLTVRDLVGNSATDSVTITVVPDTTSPTVSAFGTATIVASGGTVDVDGSGSTDDVGIRTYLWTDAVGGGTGGTFSDASSPASTYTAPTVSTNTEATLTLTATDAAGNMGTGTVSLTVLPASTVGAGIIVTQTARTVTEGGAVGVYAVKLRTTPAAGTTVQITVTASGDARVAAGDQSASTSITLDFTAADWNQSKPVIITAVDDSDGVPDAATITHTVSSVTTDTAYSALAPPTLALPQVAVTIIDDDTPALVVTPLSLGVAEGSSGTGTPDPNAGSLSVSMDPSTFTVQLATQPTGTVTVAIAKESGGDEDLNRVSDSVSKNLVGDNRSSLVFTVDNWNSAQTVFIAADEEGSPSWSDDDTSIGHAGFMLTASGADYDALTARVATSEIENDGANWTIGDAVVNESASTVRVNVVLYGADSGPSASAARVASVDYATSSTGGTATAGADYTARNGTIGPLVDGTPDVRAYYIDIPILGDTADEVDETFTVTLSNPSMGVSLGGAAVATVTIIDDDVPSVSVAVAPAGPVAEGSTGSTPVERTFTLTVAPVPVAALVVPYTITGIQAADIGSNQLTGTLNLAAGAASAATVISVVPDDIDESDETLTFTLNPPSGTDYVLGAGATAAVTITDDDDPGSLSGASFIVTPTNLTVTESGPATTYTVNLATAPASLVTVDVAASDDARVAVGTGPGAQTLTLEFTTNTPQTVTVTAVDDNDGVDDTATITHVVGMRTTDTNYGQLIGQLAAQTGLADVVVSIQDNDPLALVLTPTLLEVHEGSDAAWLLSLATQPTADVTVATVRSSGDESLGVVAGTRRTFTTLNWGETQRVAIAAAEDSDHVDGTTQFQLTATGGDYDMLTTSVTAREIDNDTGSWKITSPSVNEARSSVRLTVVLDMPGSSSSKGAQIRYQTRSGTATAGQDFTAKSGRFTVTSHHQVPNAQDRTFHLDIALLPDNLDEVDETFTVMLSHPTNHTVLGTAMGTVTIRDDDVPLLSLAVDDATAVTEGSAGDASKSRTFTVTADRAVATDLPVPYIIRGIDAADISGTALRTGGVMTIATGTVSATLPVMVVPDTIQEVDETLTTTLLTPATDAGYALGAPVSAAFVIQDDDMRAVDTTPPQAGSFAGTDGAYMEGDRVDIWVVFTEPVYVTGTPQLTINIGSGVTVDYSSGSGSGTLVFTHMVAAGQNVDDLNVISIGLNGGTITDLAANAAVLVGLPMGSNPGSLAASQNIRIDTTAPTLSSVSASSARTTTAGSYTAGDVITVSATFSEAMLVTGTPQLTLGGGGTASYVSGSGSAVLAFGYTVGSTENVDVLAVAGVDVTNGAIADLAGNVAPFTVPAGANIAATATVTIDNTAPTASAGADRTVAAGAMVTLDGTASSDPGASGSIAAYAWSQVSGTAVTLTAATTATATFLSPVSGGDLVFLLAVTDQAGIVGTDMVTITVPSDSLIISSTSLTIAEGATGSYTVAPSFGSVGVVTVVVTPSGDATVDPATLTFAAGATAAQTVTVTAGPDADAANDMASITHTTDTSADAAYAVLTADLRPSVALTITDTGTKSVIVDTPAVMITEEGAGAMVTVTLGSQPVAADGTPANADVTVTRTGGDTDIQVNGSDVALVTLAAADWATAGATFTITALNDADFVADNATFTVTVAGGDYLSTDPAAATFSVTAADNDKPTVTLIGGAFGEAAGFASLTMRLAASPVEDVTVVVSGKDGTATSESGDYSVPERTVTFKAGTTSLTRNIGVNINDDDIDELSETFAVVLTISGGAVAPDGTNTLETTITIHDNDVPAISFASTAVAVNEGAGTATVTLNLAGPAIEDYTVVYELRAGTADATDYADAGTGTVTIATGASSADISITITDDSLDEADMENFTVAVTSADSNDGPVDTLPDPATVTITDNDAPVFSLDSMAYSATEGSGTVTAQVISDIPPGRDYTITYSTADATGSGPRATAGTDYVSSSGSTIPIPSGTTAPVSLAVTLTDDTRDELAETFLITLSSVDGGANVSPTASTATITITDDDVPTFQFSSAAFMVNEADGTAMNVMTVTADGPAAQDYGLTWSTSDGSARAGTNYVAVPSGTATFPAGGTSVSFGNITITNIDSVLIKPALTFNVTLGLGTDGGTLGTLQTAVVTINDDDQPQFSISADATTIAEDGGSVTLTVTLDDAPDSGSFSVNYMVATGGMATATAGTDYVFTPSSFSFSDAGMQTFTIAITDDSIDENDETFTIMLGGQTPADAVGLNTASVTITITDNDIPMVSLAADSTSVTEGSGASAAVPPPDDRHLHADRHAGPGCGPDRALQRLRDGDYRRRCDLRPDLFGRVLHAADGREHDELPGGHHQ